MNKHKIKRGFTLVELIIVITIIAVLGSIAFAYFGGFIKTANDTKRVSDIQSVYKAIILLDNTGVKYPIPDKYLDITNLGYQGYYINKNNFPNIQGDLLDPLDGTPYLYLLSPSKKKVQLGAFLEESNYVFNNKAYAENIDYTNRYLYVYGDNIGILTDTNKVPVNETLSGTLDLSTSTGEYISYYTNSKTINGTGTVILFKITEYESELIQNYIECTLGEDFVLGECNL